MLSFCQLGSINTTDNDKIIEGATLPSIASVTRTYPKLVNYFHINFDESDVSHKEERLAQWDVLILNPDDVVSTNLSLLKIRETNQNIKLLAWIPFGQEPHVSTLLGEGIPQEDNPDNWYAKTVSGAYIYPHWGGHIMNPYKEDYA